MLTQQLHGQDSIIISNFQMRKPRLKEVKELPAVTQPIGREAQIKGKSPGFTTRLFQG